MPTAHYDGVAAWYEDNVAPSAEMTDSVRRLAGPGPGHCLDLGCGTGFYLPLLDELGWTVTAIDLSEDQLRVAGERRGGLAELLKADAADLPFADGSFELVLSAFTHTDLPDFAAAVREAERVLAPGGILVYIGPHPCFVGPHSRFLHARGIPELMPGYGDEGRYEGGPGMTPGGLREKVGAIHLPLGSLLQCVLDAGLRVDAFEEPIVPGRDYPYWLALRARR